MKNIPAYSAASDGTHSTYTIGKSPSGCAKVSHRFFLDSMLVQSDTVLSHHPTYKDMSCKIPDHEVAEVDLQPLFCEVITDSSVCPGYAQHPCATECDSYDERLCTDVGLYKAGEAPTDGRTYWDHQRMWLDFRKKGSSSADPFSDEGGDEVRSLVLEQLRRTGTWQFMSSAILDENFRQSTVEDELESFFYVLIYYGVRYLKHNSKDVASFMLAFFDGYSFSNREYSCGNGKRTLVKSAELKWNDNRNFFFTDEGSRPHPLNNLVATILPWFQGLYHVMHHEQELHEQPSSSTSMQVAAVSRSSDKRTDEYVYLRKRSHPIDSGGSKINGFESLQEPLLAARQEAASNLDGHRAMRLLLRKAVRSANWPSEDKLGDQLLMGYTSKRTRGSKDSNIATTGVKRRPEDVLAHIYMKKHPRLA